MKIETKNTKKRTIFIPINKWTILINFIVMGMIYCPLTINFTLSHPARATYLYTSHVSKMGLLYNDVQSSIAKISRNIIPKQIRNTYNKYFSSGHRFAEETSGRNLMTPPKSVGDHLVENLNKLPLINL